MSQYYTEHQNALDKGDILQFGLTINLFCHGSSLLLENGLLANEVQIRFRSKFGEVEIENTKNKLPIENKIEQGEILRCCATDKDANNMSKYNDLYIIKISQLETKVKILSAFWRAAFCFAAARSQSADSPDLVESD